jgi:hypothetical protein
VISSSLSSQRSIEPVAYQREQQPLSPQLFRLRRNSRLRKQPSSSLQQPWDSPQTGVGAQQLGAAGAQLIGAGAQQTGAAGAQCTGAGAQQLGAGAHWTGAGAQHDGAAGAQWMGAGAQQLGAAGAQQLGSPQRSLWHQSNKPASALELTQQIINAADRVSHFIRNISSSGLREGVRDSRGSHRDGRPSWGPEVASDKGSETLRYYSSNGAPEPTRIARPASAAAEDESNVPIVPVMTGRRRARDRVIPRMT